MIAGLTDIVAPGDGHMPFLWYALGHVVMRLQFSFVEK